MIVHDLLKYRENLKEKCTVFSRDYSYIVQTQNEDDVSAVTVRTCKIFEWPSGTRC